MIERDSDFMDEVAKPAGEPAQLMLDLEGFEGPIDILLTLARQQKVDLTRISILKLADQYLAFIQVLRHQRLELAADYLVMAAWLAYLKSRLLLPKDEHAEDEPSGEEMAAALQFQLRRLEAMRAAGQKLFARDLLGRDVFARGLGEGVTVVRRPIYALTVNDLLRAYAEHTRRGAGIGLRIAPTPLMSMEAAVRRLSAMLGLAIDWVTLESFLPPISGDPLVARAALAATFAASLELAREGKIRIRQDHPFAPIYLRKSDMERS